LTTNHGNTLRRARAKEGYIGLIIVFHLVKVGIFIPLRKIYKLKGRLYLIPTPLGDVDVENVIPAGVLKSFLGITFFAVEEFKTARRFLSANGFKGRIESLTLFELNEHTVDSQTAEYLKPLLNGSDMGLLSEAGLPAVADPGARLVELCHENNIDVVPLTGPSSIFLALMASGKNGQNFAFNGYLPVKTELRRAKIKELERLSTVKEQSQIFIETPYRNNAMMEDIISVCNPATKLTVACNITMEDEFIKTRRVADWKRDMPDLNKKPAVFII
jgi:16S rRNA (cytidine1402-2'-O)-methyltransferase